MGQPRSAGEGGQILGPLRALDRPVPHAQKISPVEKNVKGWVSALTRPKAAPVMGLRDF